MTGAAVVVGGLLALALLLAWRRRRKPPTQPPTPEAPGFVDKGRRYNWTKLPPGELDRRRARRRAWRTPPLLPPAERWPGERRGFGGFVAA
jgi:MYXO-CTERM domain-containing protein